MVIADTKRCINNCLFAVLIGYCPVENVIAWNLQWVEHWLFHLEELQIFISSSLSHSYLFLLSIEFDSRLFFTHAINHLQE